MAYIVNRYNGTQITVVEDGTIDQTTDLKLIGKNYSGFGEAQNENIVHLLENFSGTSSPGKAISGQVWYDAGTTKLKFYTGAAWKTAGGTEVASSEPAGLDEGDLWWSSTNNQLYGKNGAGEFILVGPQSAGSGTTQMLSVNVLDNSNPKVEKTIIVALINDTAIYVISNEEFTLAAQVDQPAGAPALGNFGLIKNGITLVNSSTGITKNSLDQDITGATGEPIVWGTVNDSLRLGGSLASDFIKTTDSLTFGDAGFTVGASADLKIDVSNGADPRLVNQNNASNKILVSITATGAGVPTDIISFRNGTDRGIYPEVTNTFSLGGSSLKFASVHATTFNGTATNASALDVGGTGRSASTTAGVNTIAARDSSGNLTAVVFNGTATKARYADLAEKYTTAEEYPIGTVMAVASANFVESVDVSAEARPAKSSDIAIGVISENPAYLMNSECAGQAIGLKGRVPVRCIGAVQKGQPVYAWEDGLASTTATRGLVGIALESSSDETEKLVECVLKT